MPRRRIAFAPSLAASVWALVLVVVPTCTSIAQVTPARGPSPGVPQRDPIAFRAMIPGVRDELKLTDDQKKRLAEVSKKYREDSSKLGDLLQARGGDPAEPGLSDQERRARGRERNELNGQLRAEVSASVEKILTPTQRTRVYQIALQIEGPLAFDRQEVLEKLYLGSDQIELIHDILLAGSSPELRESTMVLMERPSADVAEKKETRDRQAQALKFYEKAQDSMLDRILGILTKRQRQTYDQLRGEPIVKSKVLAGTIPARRSDGDGGPQMSGEWEMVSTEHQGKLVLSKDKASKVSIFIEDDSMRTEVAGKVVSRMALSVDPDKSPKEFDLTFQTGPSRGKRRRGIYRVEGNTLTYCYGAPDGPRPSEFKSPEGADIALVVAKRADNPSKPKG